MGHMASVDRKWSALPVPHAVEVPDRLRTERCLDPDVSQMEVELLWARLGQMACRLEEIPEARDFADGFLAGLPYEKPIPALRAVNLNPFERPVVDLGF